MSTIKGTVKAVFEAVQVSDKFRKREFVVTTSEQYPQDILIQMTNDKCDLVNQIGAGQEVEVHYNLRGREWQSPQGEYKYFTTIEGWKIDTNNAF